MTRPSPDTLDLVAIRRIILTAVASDDYLVEQLVLKGGNAQELVHRIGSRASVDLDVSIDRTGQRWRLPCAGLSRTSITTSTTSSRSVEV